MGLRSAFWILMVLPWAAEMYQPPLLPVQAPPQVPYRPPLGDSPPSIHHESYSLQPTFHSEASGLQHSVAERTSKAIGSSHVPAQAIHKAPASEIQSDKGSIAKEKDNKNEEYVVYYYYYYDNDTVPNNNLSLNFDDIPSLEAYDEDKSGKEPKKSASARTLATNVNSLSSTVDEANRDSSSSQPRSVSGIDKEAVIRADRHNNNFEDTVVQPLKPVPNIYRYGTNEVPRFPVLPNFVVSEASSTSRPGEGVTPLTVFSDSVTTQQASVNSHFPNLNGNEDQEDDAVNSVLDNASELKSKDDKSVEEETTTVPTTNPPTTTDAATTTTEKSSRRRPSVGGGRRRFNAQPPPTRTRSTTRGPTSSTTSTTTLSPPTRRSFQGSNRVRTRPTVGTSRGRTGSRTSEANEDRLSSSSESTTTVSSTTAARTRFTSAPRIFQSSRTRSQTSSTTSAPRSSSSSTTSSSVRSRPTSRPSPRVNLISRNRPPRPGFLRPRPGSEVEATETTTPETVETSPPVVSEEEETKEDSSSENEETSEEESEEPTTTEASRFSALFRPRNRNGNRPRPVIGNRPSRS